LRIYANGKYLSVLVIGNSYAVKSGVEASSKVSLAIKPLHGEKILHTLLLTLTQQWGGIIFFNEVYHVWAWKALWD